MSKNIMDVGANVGFAGMNSPWVAALTLVMGQTQHAGTLRNLSEALDLPELNELASDAQTISDRLNVLIEVHMPKGTLSDEDWEQLAHIALYLEAAEEKNARAASA